MNFNKKQVKIMAAVTGLGVMLMTAQAGFPKQAAAQWLDTVTPAVSEPGVQLWPAGLQSAVPVAMTEGEAAMAQAADDTGVQPQPVANKTFAGQFTQAITEAAPAVYLNDTAVKELVDTLTAASAVLPGRIAANSGKIDVGPGVANLDYAKVIRWQQNVDAGYERWRLDPLQVARQEGRQYGFSDKDTFTVVKRLAQSNLARHGEIHVKVTHNGKDYTMILVKPFGGGDAIWTTYKVVGQYKPVPPSENAGKTLFSTNKYDSWRWQKGSYLKDMAFATVVDYGYQLKQDKRIPENVLRKIKDINYNKKVVLFAYLGTAPSGGYGVGIEKVVLNGNKMTVTVHTQSPGRGSAVTLAVTQPADYVVLDKELFAVRGGVDITFVDQNGKVLSKNKLTISSHR